MAVKCGNCHSEVSITDAMCPRCGHDLMKFGGTASFPERTGITGWGVGGSSLREVYKALDRERADLRRELAGMEASLSDPFLAMFDRKIRTLISRRLSEEELAEVFQRDIVGTLDASLRDGSAADSVGRADVVIKTKLPDVFSHYAGKAPDVLRILRAGEITLGVLSADLQSGRLRDVDLSVITFPFFKAVENACWEHTKLRYDTLRRSYKVQLHAIADWLPKGAFEIAGIDDKVISKWVHTDLHGIIDNIVRRDNEEYDQNKERKLSGAKKAGVILYVCGRTWAIFITKWSEKKEKDSMTFHMNNPFVARGNDESITQLSRQLIDLQEMRNPTVHREVQADPAMVAFGRNLSYGCLQMIPAILPL